MRSHPSRPDTRRRWRARTLLPALLLLVATAVAAAPTPYRAEYEVMRNGKLLGRAQVSLQRVDASGWELRSDTRATEGMANLAGAQILEVSTLAWVDGRPESTSYRYRQDVAWRSRERSVEFDAAGGVILSRDRDREYRFDWQRGVLDRQSVVLALAQDIEAGARGEIGYTVVDRDEFGLQRYRIGRIERIDTPAGRLRARRVERVRSDARGRSTTSWHDATRGFLPVRVLQHEPDGDSFEMRLISMTRD